jgi:5-methylcytosine-specific restriction endonuclease McrA
MPRFKYCPDCGKRIAMDDPQDGQRMFCTTCRQAFTGQSKRKPVPRSQSIVRQTIDNKHWKSVKAQVIARDGPICQNHRRHGILKAFSGQQLQLDHIVPQEENPDRIWDMSNLENLCAACHARKTNEESGLGAATRRHGVKPLRITWDFRPDVWVASGYNGSDRAKEAFLAATDVSRVLILPQDADAVARLCEESQTTDIHGTLVVCSRELQYDLGKRLRARFFQFLTGLNV